MKPSGAWSSEVTALGMAKREDLKAATSKRRVRKRRIQVASRQTNPSTLHNYRPKRMRINCHLTGKARKGTRSTMHIERASRKVCSFQTRESIRRPFHVNLARPRPFRYPGQATVHKSRLPWSDSTERKCHRCCKHRWKRKYELQLPWCG